MSKEITLLDSALTLLEEEFKSVSDSKNKIDIALRPVIEQIKGYDFSISKAKGKIRKAQSFENELDAADNSYERAMVHKNCEEVFGMGNPQKVIRQEEKSIRQIERDLDKVKKRATQIGRKASRVIKKIVIDGNNMCYETGKFVGLAPLIELTDSLQKQYMVTTVFDSAIRPQLKANTRMIRSRFNKNITVHIVATKQLADETILDVASSDKSSYVISNDRFGEYLDKEVVRNKRIISHEIIDGKVIIHDLNINVSYI